MVKFIGRYIQTLSAGDTYFASAELPEKLKLSSHLVMLNYGELCPFTPEGVVYTTIDDRLLIWFTRIPLQSGKIHIPEGWAMCSSLKGGDAVVIGRGEGSAVCVVREGRMVSQMMKPPMRSDEELAELLTREHSLREPFIIESNGDYEITFSDIYTFARTQLDFSNYFRKLAADSVMPLIVLFAVLSVGDIAVSSYINSREESVSEELKEYRKMNLPIRADVDEARAKLGRWEDFNKLVQFSSRIGEYMNAIASATNELNGRLELIDYAGISITIRMQCSSASDFIEKFQDTGAFYEVKVNSAVPDRDNPSKVNINAQLLLAEAQQ
ncbi:hypothetical protein [Limisalsivibrio acetivorans]|uniref:hypothetical protein n=1 Tax=Limisalsivibrio acetivorans TaxID=1304888 RepID=UPI0003B2E451|nr:hypothetical protein [Limisalsivibrio acetivorans]